MDTPHSGESSLLERARRLSDERRLLTQLSEQTLARLLALQGNEDVADLGAGTGLYTDRIAKLTTGTVYAVELEPALLNYYRARGVPANVRLIVGDINDLPLPPASVDTACSIATLHETGGRLGLPKLLEILRPQARLVVVDWRRDAASWESGPPAADRFTADEVVDMLAPYFAELRSEKIGDFMFAVVAERVERPAESPPANG